MVRPGDLVGDRYRVIEEIASGGMGTVWRAHHEELDVDVAIKLVSADAATPSSLKRFKREAQAAARLRSPHIVQVIDFGVFEDQPYLAMELLRGEDLATRLDRVHVLPLAECATIMDGVAKAVQLAHDAGIVHRDLKPGNIFLERVGEEEIVKVLDFGIAKDLKAVADPANTTASGLVGSPGYMSPEQVWGEAVGPPADVWAMGVVLFEMLTGVNPFEDEKLAKIFEKIIREPIPSVRTYNGGLPEAFDDLLAAAFARKASDRIQSPKELADGVRKAIDDPSATSAREFDPHAATMDASEASRTAVTEDGLLGPTPEPAKTDRRWTLLAVAALVLVVGGIGFISTRSAGIGTSPDSGRVQPSGVPSTAVSEEARAEAPRENADARAAPASEDAGAAAATPTSSASPAPPSSPLSRRSPKPVRAPRAAPRPAPKPEPAPPAAPSLDPRFGIPAEKN